MDYSINKNGIRILSASEGYVLTQKYLDDEEERIYASEIFLGRYDNKDNWIEMEII